MSLLSKKESASTLLKLIFLFYIPISPFPLCFLRQRPYGLSILRRRHITLFFKLPGKIMNGGVAQLVCNLGKV